MRLRVADRKAEEAAYTKWRRRYGSGFAAAFDRARFSPALSELGRELHAKHLEEFSRELTAHGAPQRIMMLRQMNAELKDELRKRDAPIWANALPGHAASD